MANNKNSNLAPVLKWAGGKTQLLEKINSKLPQNYNNYFEPFIGGGAVIFNVCPKHAFINDCNVQLINLYNQIKNSATNFISLIEEYDSKDCDKEYYLLMREKYNDKIKAKELDVESASLMVWLNKHCFNGLYRVNSRGLFNVPYNQKVKGSSIDPQNILNISEYFNNAKVNISCADFEEVCDNVRSGDFVYFDSPYLPVSETAQFTDYTKDGFTYEDHMRLAELFKRLDKKGALVMLSNNDVPLAHDLYGDYKIESFDVKRMINCNSNKRKGRELIVTNY